MMEVSTTQIIPTEIVNEVVLPYIRDWFQLDEHHNILPEIAIEATSSGGAVVRISLGDMIAPFAMEELREALRAAQVELI